MLSICPDAPSTFHYLNQGNAITVGSIDDLSDFSTLCEALQLLGMTDQQLRDVWAVLAAILHLGNVRVEADECDNSFIEAAVSSLKSCTVE